jgi:hypothetical protein
MDRETHPMEVPQAGDTAEAAIRRVQLTVMLNTDANVRKLVALAENAGGKGTGKGLAEQIAGTIADANKEVLNAIKAVPAETVKLI